MQQRLESSPAGRAVISVFVAATVLCLVLWNLPDDSALQRETSRIVRPYMLATGLSQNWGVFAPNPRRETLAFEARVTYADGTTETKTVPRGGLLVGSYWDYRWRKWYEYVRGDDYKGLWQPAAAWFAARAEDEGRQPVRVTLVRRWRASLPPGDGPSHGPWQEDAFYAYELTPSGEDGE